MTIIGTTYSGAPEWERDLDSPSYTRYMRRIPILTGTEREASSELLEVRYRARKPIWTTTPPTAPGWWWCRAVDNSMGIPVRVEQFPDGLRFSVLFQDWEPITTGGVLWSDGPVVEPEDAH